MYLGKDLSNKELKQYFIAKDDKEVYSYIEKEYIYDDWPEASDMSKREIMKDKGDFEAEYNGEFYDTKYGWELVTKNISDEDIAILTKHKIL